MITLPLTELPRWSTTVEAPVPHTEVTAMSVIVGEQPLANRGEFIRQTFGIVPGEIFSDGAVHNLLSDMPDPLSSEDPGKRVCQLSLNKVVCRIYSNGLGAVAMLDGLGVVLVEIHSSSIDVFFTGAFRDEKYIPVCTNLDGAPRIQSVDYNNSSATKIRIQTYSLAGGGTIIDPAVSIVRFGLHVCGRVDY